MKTKIFAIYKNSNLLGNEICETKEDDIKKYILAAKYETLLNYKIFMSQYTAKPAIKNLHYR